METTSLATARADLSKFVEQVVSTRDRVTITRNGKVAAVLISADDLESLEETVFWLSNSTAPQPGDDDPAAFVGLDVVRQEVADRLAASDLDPATRAELLTRLQNVRE